MHKNIVVVILLSFLIPNLSFGQKENKYTDYVKEAWSLYKSKDYKQSAKKYEEAFDDLDGKAVPSDRYNAACSYALAKNIKKSFNHLFYLAENKKIKYRSLEHLSKDTDLKILHSKKKWGKLIEIVTLNKTEYEKDFDKPLMTKLDNIRQSDQGYRREISKIEKKYGRQSDEMKAHWQKIHEADSINLVEVKKILDERGWLGAKVVGYQGNQTLFLVIQHADLETQVKYLPMMREAVKLGNAQASSLAMLEDRVALRQGKRQIYGSQVGRDRETGEYYVSPLIEPEKVNDRRAAVGLGTIQDYISHWDITWDVEKHKQRTKKIESIKKK